MLVNLLLSPQGLWLRLVMLMTSLTLRIENGRLLLLLLAWLILLTGLGLRRCL